jgi:beta-N-acetylhexosaminidase
VLAGLRAGGVAACLKHFPGHGATTVDSHLALPVGDADRATLDAREIAPFRAHRAAPSVMTAHVVYRALDAERPGTFSRAIVTDLLRGQLGFTGVAITDALEMKGAAEGREPAEAARLALEAGCDLLLFAFHSENVRRARLELAKALVDGRIEHAAFDDARPRLAEFDRAYPEPSAEELGRPLADLTPTGWRERIDGIIERGLVVRGALAAPPGPWHVTEPEFARGATLRSMLERNGVAVTDDPAQATARVVAVASRVPLTAAATEELRAGARAKPTALLGLQNDAFLDDVTEAALRISAADATEPTREGVARRLVKEFGRS